MTNADASTLALLTAAVTMNLPTYKTADGDTDQLFFSRVIAAEVMAWAVRMIPIYGSIDAAIVMTADAGIPLYDIADSIGADIIAKLDLN